MVNGHQCPSSLLSLVYLLRISTLVAAFQALFHRADERATHDKILAVQIILSGQCLSCAPIAYWSMKQSKWPQPDWSCIVIEIARDIVLISLWLLFTFCSILLLGAPAFRLQLSIELTYALASLILPALLINYSLSKSGRKLRLIDQLMLASLEDTVEKNYLRCHCISVLAAAWFGGLTLFLDWRDEWKVYPVANILLAVLVSIICNCIYLSSWTVSLVQKWTNY